MTLHFLSLSCKTLNTDTDHESRFLQKIAEHNLTPFIHPGPQHINRYYVHRNNFQKGFEHIILTFTMLIFLAEVEETLEELADYVKKQRWWNRVFGKNNSRPLAEKYSVGGQIAIGGLTGW